MSQSAVEIALNFRVQLLAPKRCPVAIHPFATEQTSRGSLHLVIDRHVVVAAGSIIFRKTRRGLR
jgi:hypothetical protein